MYDLGEEKGLHFITMEYISGQDLIYLVLYVAAIFSIIANIFLLAYSGNELGPLDLNSLIFVFSLIAVLIFGGVLIYRCLFRKSRFKFIDNYFVRLAFLFFCGFSFLVCVDPLNIFYLNKDWWEIQLWITLIIFIIGAVIIYKHLGDFYYCVQQNVGPVGNILCRGEFFGRMADPVNLTPS
jgi:hypothetical protein